MVDDMSNAFEICELTLCIFKDLPKRYVNHIRTTELKVHIMTGYLLTIVSSLLDLTVNQY